MGVVKNVIPAKAGIQNLLKSLDPRLRKDDKNCIFHHSLYVAKSPDGDFAPMALRQPCDFLIARLPKSHVPEVGVEPTQGVTLGRF